MDTASCACRRRSLLPGIGRIEDVYLLRAIPDLTLILPHPHEGEISIGFLQRPCLVVS